MRKKHVCIIIAIVTWVSVIFALAGCSRFVFQNSKGKVFSRDYTSLSLVADYLVSLEHDSVYIPSEYPDGEILASGTICFIDNDDIVNAIAILREAGCSVIDKDAGVITFVYWSTSDVGKGFAYSSDGSDPQLQFQTYLEKLSMENWFYYEEDFNLWRLENQESN